MKPHETRRAARKRLEKALFDRVFRNPPQDQGIAYVPRDRTSTVLTAVVVLLILVNLAIAIGLHLYIR